MSEKKESTEEQKKVPKKPKFLNLKAKNFNPNTIKSPGHIKGCHGCK